MEITTIACPKLMSDSNIDKNTSPIWVDSKNNEYFVASGLLDGYSTTTPVEATKTRVNIIVGVDGLVALSMMGLLPKPEVP